jgi:hypothetical protein
VETETGQHREYTRREIAVIIVIILAAAVLIGNFTTSTTAVESSSSGPLTISLNATCTGFGAPTYWNSLDPDNNVTTYQYGFCLFGFWVSNGHPLGGYVPTVNSGSSID